MVDTKYSCCKVTMAIYYQWIATVWENQSHQDFMHTTLIESLKQVLGDYSMQNKIPAHNTSKSRSKRKTHKCITSIKALSTEDDFHSYQISCALLKCKNHEQIYSIKESSKIREIVGLSAASLNSPMFPINTKDVARVLRCLRCHLLPASSRRPGC